MCQRKLKNTNTNRNSQVSRCLNRNYKIKAMEESIREFQIETFIAYQSIIHSVTKYGNKILKVQKITY